jgi:SEC-C motif
MGAIADAIVAFAQPLLDQTDGSVEQMNKAFQLSQLCYNLALVPKDSREASIGELRQSLEMDDAEFDAFRSEILVPMIQRHEAMFPMMHRPGSRGLDLLHFGHSPPAQPRMPEVTPTNPKPDRYAPCPCNSGRKYKFCCGSEGR